MFMNAVLRRWHALLLALGFTFVLPPAEAAGGVPAGQRRIVLVHGAFSDGSAWAPVIERLQRRGYQVSAVQNPLTSLADDVAATRRVLQRQPGDVILVGHSWAGAVITEAGNAANVKGLVYLSALVPDSGESVAEVMQRLGAPMDGLKPDAEGLVWLDDPQAYRDVMAGDLPPPLVARLAATQQPIAARAFGDKIGQAAWRSRPAWYLITEDDRALPPRVQRELAQRIGATTRTLKASHLSLLSHPDAVAALIEQAARAAGR
jgi:pimeloyl-ACP methyl ester carboxylesterase